MKLPITLNYDDFHNLTISMFESNNGVIFWVEWYPNMDVFNFDSRLSHVRPWPVTITSIEVRLPQFSIGDTVMIVDTGEIGYIWKWWWEWIVYIYKTPWERWDNDIFDDDWIWWVYREELVKIPTDLLPILQD